MHLRGGLMPHIIPVHAHIEAAYRNWKTPDVIQDFGESLGEVNAASLDTYQDDGATLVVPFYDLVADSCEDAMNGRGIQDNGFLSHNGGRAGAQRERPLSEEAVRCLKSQAFPCLGDLAGSL